jgi:hypothetical protein
MACWNIPSLKIPEEMTAYTALRFSGVQAKEWGIVSRRSRVYLPRDFQCDILRRSINQRG